MKVEVFTCDRCLEEIKGDNIHDVEWDFYKSRAYHFCPKCIEFVFEKFRDMVLIEAKKFDD